MTTIPVTGRSLIGPEGRVLVNGAPWHDTATDVSWDMELVTIPDYPIRHEDQALVHIDRKVNMTMDSRHVLNDTVAEKVMDTWTDGTPRTIAVSGEGMKVGDSCQIHCVTASGRTANLSKDSLQTSTLTAESAGLSFGGIIQQGFNSVPGTGDYVFPTSGVPTTGYSGALSTISNVPIATVTTPTGLEPDVIGVFFKFRAISGFAGLTGDSTLTVSLRDTDGNLTSLTNGSVDIPLTGPLFDIYVTRFTGTPMDVVLAVNFGGLPTGQTNYNIVYERALSYVLANA